MTKEADNTVYIGDKPSIQYLMAVQTQASRNDTVFIRARGKMIGKAVNVSQGVVNKFLRGWKVKNVKIGTETKNVEKDGKEFKANVSYIVIELGK